MSQLFVGGVVSEVDTNPWIKKGEPGDLQSQAFQAINLGIFLYTDLTEQMVVDQNGHPPQNGRNIQVKDL